MKAIHRAAITIKLSETSVITRFIKRGLFNNQIFALSNGMLLISFGRYPVNPTKLVQNQSHMTIDPDSKQDKLAAIHIHANTPQHLDNARG